MRIGILGTADIAFRRFLPALQKCQGIEYAGIASRVPEKTVNFTKVYGGKGYPSYEALLTDENIDAVYVPLPPALHYEWGKKVLESGKHLFMEKPFTTNLRDTQKLLELAEKKGLAVHENYMFLYHSQLKRIKELIADGTLGELRLIRAAFGFPKRSEDDFRYKKALGGGALLDCGGYPVRLALDLLGDTVQVTQSRLIQPKGYEVDLYGNAVLENRDGLTAQVSFGMDNAYQCQLEVWGNKATVIAPRIFTAGVNFIPQLILKTSDNEELIDLPQDDQFQHSIELFFQEIENTKKQMAMRNGIYRQAMAIEEIREKGNEACG